MNKRVQEVIDHLIKIKFFFALEFNNETVVYA